MKSNDFWSLPALAVAFLGVVSGSLQATPLVTINMVEVGDPGNFSANATNASSWGSTYGYGAVGYDYRIGTYEVTIGQYNTFLNAVAASDPFELYNTSMGTDLNIAGITRSGSPGTYTYSVDGSGDRPITYVSFYNAAMFTNWLHNGATTSSSITSGAYQISTGTVTQVSRSSNVATLTSSGHTLSAGDQVTVSGTTGYNVTSVVTAVTTNTFSFAQTGSDQVATAASGNMTGASATRDAGATWWLPSEDEWVKAAYYDPGTGNYSLHANQSNSITTNTIGAAGGANYFDGDFATTQSGYLPTQNYLTDVGAYGLTTSFYGTYDQGGNVWEWNEAILGTTGFSRGLRGGSWDNDELELRASSFSGIEPSYESYAFGFRVASVPEPSAAMLMMLGGGALLLRKRRRG